MVQLNIVIKIYYKKEGLNMTLQQLRYVIKIVETGSISAAAKELYVSQPSLSKAVMELEDELDTTLFIREKTGIRLTDDGSRFLVRARQVMEQMDLLEKEFAEPHDGKVRFSVASQHYNFVVGAMAHLIKELGEDSYEFAVREMPTKFVIDDVKSGTSEIGIIYLSEYNNEVIRKKLNIEGLEFKPLFREKPHVFIGDNNELASRETLKLEDLEGLPRISYEQLCDDSYFFYEELYSAWNTHKDITVLDKASLIYFVRRLGGYNISTSVPGARLESLGAKAIPLESDEYMEIGYIQKTGRPLSELAKRMVELIVQAGNGEIIL